MSSTHTKTMPCGHLLDINKLIEVIHSRDLVVPLLVEISSIKGLSKSRKLGFSKRRYEKADLRFPVIVDENLNLLDGRHRTLKAKDLGKQYVSALVASPDEIEECMRS